MIYETLIYNLLIIFIAILIDLLYGELPNKIHPVIYMGNVIEKLKNYLPKTRFSGLLIIVTSTFIFTILTLLILLISGFINQWLYLILASIILSSTFSINFLIESVNDIKYLLQTDLEKARESMSYLVSRDTTQLTESRITSAAIETLSENITDSVIAPLFYIAIIGLFFGAIPTILFAVFYRLSNTMDAMLGYTTNELIDIGRYPAKLDDYLNYIPAKITGYYVILASFLLKYDYKQSYNVMKKFALKTPSPNSGYSMSATAGAINVTLTKEGVYTLGYGTDELNHEKITKAINLTKVTSILFILTILIVYVIRIIFLL